MNLSSTWPGHAPFAFPPKCRNRIYSEKNKDQRPISNNVLILLSTLYMHHPTFLNQRCKEQQKDSAIFYPSSLPMTATFHDGKIGKTCCYAHTTVYNGKYKPLQVNRKSCRVPKNLLPLTNQAYSTASIVLMTHAFIAKQIGIRDFIKGMIGQMNELSFLNE